MQRITWADVMQSDKLQNGELKVFLDNDEILMGPVETITVNYTEVVLKCPWMAKSRNNGDSWYSIEESEVRIPQTTEPLWFEEIDGILVVDGVTVYRLSPEHTTIRLAEEPDDGTWRSPLCGND